jgi:hypothetical protein
MDKSFYAKHVFMYDKIIILKKPREYSTAFKCFWLFVHYVYINA